MPGVTEVNGTLEMVVQIYVWERTKGVIRGDLHMRRLRRAADSRGNGDPTRGKIVILTWCLNVADRRILRHQRAVSKGHLGGESCHDSQ